MRTDRYSESNDMLHYQNDSPNIRVTTQYTSKDQNEYSSLDKQEIQRQKRYYIYKLKNQTDKLNKDYEKYIGNKNSRFMMTTDVESNIWQQTNQQYGQEVLSKYSHKFDKHEFDQRMTERQSSKQIDKNLKIKKQGINNDKLIEEIENLKRQNEQLRKIISEFNELSANYSEVIETISIDIKRYKHEIECRDKIIASIKQLDIQKADIINNVSQSIIFKEQICLMKKQMVVFQEKIKQLTETIQRIQKQKQQYQQIIFEQECQKKFYLSFLQDYYKIHLKIQQEKPILLNNLIKLRNTQQN